MPALSQRGGDAVPDLSSSEGSDGEGSPFDLYVAAESWLHRMDPRVKVLAVLLLSAAGLAFRHVVLLAGLLLAAHAALLTARIPARRLRWLWSRLLPLLIMILVLQPILAPGPGPDLLRAGPLRWTADGLLGALSFALRAAALAFVTAVLLLTTDSARLVQGLVRLGLPYEWGLTIALAFRYLPETYGLYVAVMEAQQARGWVVGEGHLLRRARSYLPVFVATIIASLRKADGLGLALAARGLGYTRSRTVLHDIRLRTADWTALLLILALFAGLMVVRFALGWGGSPW
jgi:energy-coupling factor transport system permease protein